jgi:hypothetical protein
MAFCNQKRRLYADRLRQLNKLGLPMPFECGGVDNQTSQIAVEQAAPDIECPIVDLQDGRTLYIVWLSLAAERSGVRLYDYRFEPPWPDHNFQQLPNFADSHIGEFYCLPGGLEYPRGDVLSLNFLKTGWRLPNTGVEGVLCALSATSIPEEFKHGASIRVGLKFFGRSGQQLAAASVVLWADRWHEPALTRPSTKPLVAMDESGPTVAARPSRSGLYEQGEGNDLCAADEPGENGAQGTAGASEGSSRTTRFGE